MTPDMWKDLLQLGFSFAVAGVMLYEMIHNKRALIKTMESQAAVLPQILTTLQAMTEELKDQGRLIIEHVEREKARSP